MFRKPALAALLAALAHSALPGGGSAAVTNTRITSGPSGTIFTDSATFTFASPLDGGFECRLDTAPWSACTSPTTYTSLADGVHRFEVRALNRPGHPDPTPTVAIFTVQTEPEPPAPVIAPARLVAETGPPKPLAGETLNLEAQKGNVQLQCPGEDSYERLVGFKQVPVGCLINTRNGVVDITASKGSSGELQNADFWGGVFIATQPKGDDQEVELKLAGRRMCERRSREGKPVARASRGGRSGRKLWGSGKGNYSTGGSYGSATVRGTTWLVVDRCDASTLIKVAEGTVAVRDFVKDRSLTLEAGEQYVAKAAIPRLNPDALP